ncbi:hypothetical protein CALCODRAFT_522142 [Calocera cornea HHB12733]|uniref:F-box domain-containing protein n=1 Tax=Calocera cornea HHB12733 TaxID=1353952 RepID=A0A166MQF7_9BASI|nr:hypothetical protein CALCODRAFT_522142 [Calocera cornea HHB12733]
MGCVNPFVHSLSPCSQDNSSAIAQKNPPSSSPFLLVAPARRTLCSNRSIYLSVSFWIPRPTETLSPLSTPPLPRMERALSTPELLIHILGYLHVDDPTGLITACMVCRSWAAGAQPYIFQTISSKAFLDAYGHCETGLGWISDDDTPGGLSSHASHFGLRLLHHVHHLQLADAHNKAPGNLPPLGTRPVDLALRTSFAPGSGAHPVGHADIALTRLCPNLHSLQWEVMHPSSLHGLLTAVPPGLRTLCLNESMLDVIELNGWESNEDWEPPLRAFFFSLPTSFPLLEECRLVLPERAPPTTTVWLSGRLTPDPNHHQPASDEARMLAATPRFFSLHSLELTGPAPLLFAVLSRLDAPLDSAVLRVLASSDPLGASWVTAVVEGLSRQAESLTSCILLLSRTTSYNFKVPEDGRGEHETNEVEISLDTFRPLTRCPRLRNIRIQDCTPSGAARFRISSHDLDILAEVWPDVRELDLTTAPSGHAFDHLPAHWSVPTINCLAILAEKCPRLASLRLTFLQARPLPKTLPDRGREARSAFLLRFHRIHPHLDPDAVEVITSLWPHGTIQDRWWGSPVLLQPGDPKLLPTPAHRPSAVATPICSTC